MCFRNNCLPNIEKERLFRRLRATKCLLRKSLAAGALCRHTSDILLRFPEASLLEEIPRQGLFSQGESIPARRNPFSGIIFPRRKHPCSKKSPVRDYFPEAKASLLGEIPRQGLFSRGGLFARNHVQNLRRTRRTQANVYQSYLISRRAASFASSAAPEAGTVIPSCAPHYGRNLPVFFPERG